MEDHVSDSTNFLRQELKFKDNTQVEQVPSISANIKINTETLDNDEKVSKSPPKKKKKRCYFEGCKKKLGLHGHKCKCTHTFCSMHRLSFNHNCAYDFKKDEKDVLATKVTAVIADKVIKI